MASITVRNLDDELKRRLRIRAAENGRSMEQEARDILRSALKQEPSGDRGPGKRHPRPLRAPWWGGARTAFQGTDTRTASVGLRRKR